MPLSSHGNGRRRGGADRPDDPTRSRTLRWSPAGSRPLVGAAACPLGAPRRCLLVGALVGVLALAGCGGSQNALQTVVSAAKTTLGRSVESSTTLANATAFGGGRTSVVARAAFAFPTGIGYEGVDLPASGTQPAGPVYLAFTPTTVYLQPRAPGVLPKGRSWFTVRLADSRSVSAAFPSLIEQLQGLSPQLLLAELAWGSKTAKGSGARVVNHVPLTQYVATVDLRRVLSAATGPSAAAVRLAVEKELAALGSVDARRPALVRLTVGINGPGLVTMVRGTVPGSGLGTVAVSFSDFAVKVPKNLPGSAQVAEVTALPPAARGPFAPWALPAAR
jgi:hypothetical protein